jgi:hypothetical protein
MWHEGEGKRQQDPNRPWAFGIRPERRFARQFGNTPAGERRLRPVPGRSLQELGTIEAGSKVEITVCSKAGR